MSDLAKLIALLQLHGLEGWTLADTHRLKELAEQHAAQLRELMREYGDGDIDAAVGAAADFLATPRKD